MTEKQYKLERWTSASLYYSFPTGSVHQGIGYVIEKVEKDLNQLAEENERLKKSFSDLIDKKIDEFKNGDYGDLPYNTIHMLLDLKEEMGDLE